MRLTPPPPDHCLSTTRRPVLRPLPGRWPAPFFWLSMLMMSLAIAGDTPPQTLPRGFLEQLPLLEKLSDREFDALARFAATRPEPSSNKRNDNAGGHDDDR